MKYDIIEIALRARSCLRVANGVPYSWCKGLCFDGVDYIGCLF